MSQKIEKATKHGGLLHVKEFRCIRHVSDLAALRAFYDEYFDWPITDQWDTGIMYDTGAVIFELIQKDNVDMPNDASCISISIPDVWALFEKMKDKVKIVFPLRDNSWGDTSFQMQDPEGYKITLFTPTKIK